MSTALSFAQAATDYPAEIDKMGVNGLKLRFADCQKDVEDAQNVRYQVFYQEMGAKPIKDMAALERDYDEFDPVSRHLLVVDTNDDPTGRGKVVGTYRMFMQKNEQAFKPFYTEGEFDISGIKGKAKTILEVGRSCILPDYRKRFVMQLLWQGLGAFVYHHEVDFMIGCGSLDGVVMQDHAMTLSYLYHYHLAREEIRPKALPAMFQSINLLPAEQINEKEAFMALPPLIKGYLRLGGKVGDGAIIDEQFNTVDVCVLVETAGISEKHREYYRRDRSQKDGEI